MCDSDNVWQPSNFLEFGSSRNEDLSLSAPSCKVLVRKRSLCFLACATKWQASRLLRVLPSSVASPDGGDRWWGEAAMGHGLALVLCPAGQRQELTVHHEASGCKAGIVRGPMSRVCTESLGFETTMNLCEFNWLCRTNYKRILQNSRSIFFLISEV